MNLNKKIEELMKKYEISLNEKGFLSKIQNEIRNIIYTACKGKKVAIRGAREHTQALMKLIDEDINIIGVFDITLKINGTVQFADRICNVYPVSELEKEEVDIVLISSFAHRKEIHKELLSGENKYTILDIYNELEKRGIYLQEAYYFNTIKMYTSVLYYKNRYEQKKGTIDEKDCLEDVIYSYLNIRDFVNAQAYINIYIEEGFDKEKRMKAFREELSSFLNSIKKEIQNRKKRDILIIWNDQLGYGDLESCPFLFKESKNSLFLENAFTPVPFTYPAFRAMFEKQYSIDDKIYFVKSKKIDGQNMFVKTLLSKGYDFRYIGDGPTALLIEEKYAIGFPSYDSSCVRCFQMLEEVINSEKPICIMLHEVVETHNPFLSGKLKEMKWYEWPYIGLDLNKVNNQAKESALYWSEQIQFYKGFFGEQTTTIYMSDHGKRYEAEPIYKDLATHIVMFVKDNRLLPQREDGLFELSNLCEMVEYLSDDKLQDSKYREIFTEYIKMQEVGIFNNMAINYYIQQKQPESAMPYRAARGKDDKYVLLNTGKEYYYRIPDEEKNEIDNPEYQERIQILRECAGNEFLSFNDYYAELTEFRKLYECHD